jgi:hypothetical protein
MRELTREHKFLFESDIDGIGRGIRAILDRKHRET